MSERKKITIGILAHVDAGKTTLSEAILYKCGAIRKAGRVDHGDALLDSDSQEKERGITIFAGQAVVDVGGTEVTLLDTPGHVDFSAEMERTLKVLDYAVLVVSGKDGVQSHTWTLWKLLRQYGIPVFIFVNKMDLESTDRGAIMDELRMRFGSECCDMNGSAEEIAMCSEDMLEEYLAGGTVSDDSIAKAIKTRKLFSCYFGSALKMEGVDELMDALDMLTIGYGADVDFGYGAETGKTECRVFRVTRDKQGERLTHLKVLAGTLRVRDEIGGGQDGGTGGEKINQIRIYSGDKYQTVEEAGPGTVCQVTGPQELLPDNDSVLEALMVYGVRLPDGVNVHEAYAKIRQLGEEDPQLQITWNSQLREIQLKLMGQVQLEVLQEMIKRRFGIDAEFTEGRIAYKETIAETIEGAGHYEPLRHYAEVHLLMEPLPRGSGMEFGSQLSEDVLDRNWQRLIMTHLLEKEHVGTLTGSPVTDMRISIIAGRAHEKHTEGGDFRQATYRAIRQGLRKSLADGNMILLEPYYDFELEVPRDMVGRSMADIQRMSGECGAPEDSGADDMTTLRGRAPVSEMKEYVTEVASYTKGRGRLVLSFGGYDVCHNQDEVVAASGYDPDADAEESADSVFCSHGAGHLVSWDEADDMMHVSAARRTASDESDNRSAPTSGQHRTSDAAGLGDAPGLGGMSADDKELERIFDRTFKSSKSDKPSIEAREFDSELERRKKAAERRRRAAEAERRRDEMLLPEYLLVDGYNIIFAWDELKQLAKENIDSAREALIEILGNYQGFRKCSVIAVFDAYKVKGGQRHFEEHGGVTVVYTKEAETADAYIERTTYELSGKGNRSGKRYRVRVATSDRLEQMIILGNNAHRVSANDFREEVKQVNEEIREYLKQLARRNEIENPNKLIIE